MIKHKPEELTTNEADELIAKFMGCTFSKNLGRRTYHNNPTLNSDGESFGFVVDLQYYYSWDWLMPSWVKFLKLLNDENLLQRNFPYWGEWYSNICGAIIKGEIGVVHRMLSEGIKWYIDSKQTP